MGPKENIKGEQRGSGKEEGGEKVKEVYKP